MKKIVRLPKRLKVMSKGDQPPPAKIVILNGGEGREGNGMLILPVDNIEDWEVGEWADLEVRDDDAEGKPG